MDLVFSDIHADLNALDLIISTASSEEFVKKYDSFSRIINWPHPQRVVIMRMQANY